MNEIINFLSAIAMVFTHAVGMVKLWILIYQGEKIMNIRKKLQDEQFKYKSLDDFKPGLRMQKARLNIMLISTFLFLLYSCVGISSHISGIVMLQKNIANNTHFLNNSSCKDFILHTVYSPFNLNTPLRCHGILAIMDIGLDIFAFYIATLDSVYVSLLQVLAIQLIILNDAFTTIRKRCLMKFQIIYNAEAFYDIYNPQLENSMFKELTRCTKHLYSLLKVRDEIEDIFSLVTLTQVIGSLLIFASCLFGAAREPLFSPNFFSQLEYFLAVLLQLSVYCWYGNQITLSAAAMPNALYNSDWLFSSLRYRKSMLMTMNRMIKPLYVSIGKFTPLSLTTLLSVLKGSFSYFTLFQRAEV